MSPVAARGSRADNTGVPLFWQISEDHPLLLVHHSAEDWDTVSHAGFVTFKAHFCALNHVASDLGDKANL